MSKHQLNIWDMTDKNDPECLESVELDLEDGRYGDNNESVYLTGHTKLGKFVEVVVTVPERANAVKLGEMLHKIIAKVVERRQDQWTEGGNGEETSKGS